MFLMLITQPIITGVILVYFFNLDPVFVFITAIIIQLYYFKSVPSGTVLFPEYPFSYFIITGSLGLVFNLVQNANKISIYNHIIENNLYIFILLTVIGIIFSSYLVSRFYSLKNQFLEKRIGKDLNSLGTTIDKKFFKIGIYSTTLTILIAVISSIVIFLLVNFLSYYVLGVIQ